MQVPEEIAVMRQDAKGTKACAIAPLFSFSRKHSALLSLARILHSSPPGPDIFKMLSNLPDYSARL